MVNPTKHVEEPRILVRGTPQEGLSQLVKERVIVSKGENPYLTAKRGLQKFPLPDLRGRKILIKPNAARVASPGEGITTHPQVVAATIDGVGLLIAFNVKYLREALEVIKSPNVALETSAPNAPGVVRPVGDDNFLHVIMPMHLG